MYRKKITRCLVSALLVLLAALPVWPEVATNRAHAQTAAPDLLITEIVPTSAEVGQPYEFVEIYNNTSRDIDLDGYELQYFTTDMNNPANTWEIKNKVIKARSALVLWLKKFDYPDVPLWDFNANYDVKLSPSQVFEVTLKTSGQGLHDSALRKVGIAGRDGQPISTAYINQDGRDGIANKSVIYQYSGSGIEMAKIRNGERPTTGVVLPEQIPGPKTPGGLKAQPGNQYVFLEWHDADALATAYNLYSSGSEDPITVTGATYYTLAGLENDVEYEFRVTAVDANGGESPASEAVKATPQEIVDLEPPDVPSGLRVGAGNKRVDLSWNSNTEPDLAGYRIYVDGAFCCSVPAGERNVSIAPLTLGRKYSFAVSAVDRAGNESAPSAPVEATPSENTDENPMPELLITELIPDTDNYAGYDAFEFIELYNTTPGEIDLLGYKVKSGNWEKTIDRSITIAPWETLVLWTRRAEIRPLSLEALNSYYFSSYKSKYLAEHNVFIMDDVGGLKNSGNQTVTLYDPFGREICRAAYSAADVVAGKSIVYGFPPAGSTWMNLIEAGQKPTPGWVVQGQVPPKPQQDGQAPLPPENVQAVAGDGFVTLTWAENSEPDIFRYNIYKDGMLEHSVPASENRFTVYGLTGNQAYAFQVSALDTSDNESPKSVAIVATPNHQKITQQERVPHAKDPSYSMLWDISDDGPVIPGLVEDLVPQGIAYYQEKDWLLVVSYLDDGRPATLSVVDARTGALVKSVVLYEEDGTPYTGHAGGIAVSRTHAWIASENYLYQIELDELAAASDQGEIRFAARIPVPITAAFATYSNGVLWAGEFYEPTSYPTDPSHHLINRSGSKYFAWMTGYSLDPQTDSISERNWDNDPNHPAIPDYILSVPDKIQGAVLREDVVILSSSYGRNNDSLLYRYRNPMSDPPHTLVNVGGRNVPVWFLDSLAETETNSRLVVIPMSEGIVDVGDVLYVVFESGANKYRYTTKYIMDRILKLDLGLWDQYGMAFIDGIPSTMKVGDSAQARVLEARGKSEPNDLTSSFRFQSSHPEVAEVSPTGQVMAKAAGEAVIAATDGDRSVAFRLVVSNVSSPTPGAGKERSRDKKEPASPPAKEKIRNLPRDKQEEVNRLIRQYETQQNAHLTLLADVFEYRSDGVPELVRIPVQRKINGIPTGVYKVEDDGTLTYIGGKWSGESIEVGLAEPGRYAVIAYDKTYSDLPPGHWSYEAVRALSAMQVVRGVNATEFAPHQKVTRAEFIAMLVRALGLEAKGTPNLADIDGDDRYAEAMVAAKEAGLVSGMGNGTFTPHEALTREQMASLLVRAYEMRTKQTLDRTVPAPFTDLGQVSAWAKGDIHAAYSVGLIHGRGGGVYAPKEGTTRAEAAVAIHHLLAQMK